MASGGAGGKEVGRLSIRVVPDMDGFREKVEAEARGAGKDVKIPVDADTTKARSEIRELTDEKRHVPVDLDLDARGFREKLAAETRPTKVNVRVDYDEGALDKLKKNMDRFLTNESLEMGKAHQRLSEVFRNNTPEVVGGKIRAEAAAKQLETEKAISALYKERFRDARLIAAAGGGGGGSGILSKIGGVFGGGNASLGTGAALSQPVLIVGAVLSLLAPALSLLSQALVGLPALVAAVALPIGVFALGIGGVKKALDDSGLLDLVTGKKGKETQKIGTDLKNVQKDVSDVFEKGFTPLFTQVRNALPALTRGLPFVAKGIVDLANGLGKALLSPENIANFDRFTNSVSTMLSNLGPGLGSFTNGMTNLITNVGDHLPGLGSTMSEWAGEFESWVTKISKPQQFWGKDVPNSSELDQGISNLKPILESVKNFIGDLVAAGLKLASSKEMTDNIKSVVDGLTNLVISGLPAMNKIFGGIADAMKLFGVDTHGYGEEKTKFWGRDVPTNKPPVKPENTSVWSIPGVTGPDGKPHMPDWWNNATRAGSRFLNNLDFGDNNPNSFRNQPKNLSLQGTDQKPVPVIPVQTPQSSLAPVFPGLGLAGGPRPSTPPPAIPGVQGAAQAPVSAPKIEAPKLPPGSDKIWQPLIQSTQAASTQVNGIVQQMVGQITAAMKGLGPAGNAAGLALGQGMANGIQASTAVAVARARDLASQVEAAAKVQLGIHSPSTKFHAIGQNTAQGFDDGMSEGFQGVIAKASALSQQVHDAMANGGVLSPTLKAQVQKETAAIGIQYDQLSAQRDKLDPKDKAGRKELQDQMKQLQSLRKDLGLSDKESDYGSKFGAGKKSDSTQQAASMITQALASALDGLKTSAMAGVSQLEGDLGMSGNGVVEKLGDYGIGFLTSSLNSVAQSAFGGGKNGNTYNFQSMDHDGTMKNYERVKHRESLQHTQRNN